MSNETEQPKIQADESQEKEQAETLSKPGDESSKPEGQVADDQLPQEGGPKDLHKPEDESSKPEGQVADDQLPQEGGPKDLHKPEDESSKPEGQVADDQPSQEGDPKATEPEERAEDPPQPNPRMSPTSTHPVRWVIVFLLAIVIFYHFGYLRGQSEEQMKNISHVPEKEVVLQTDLKAIEEAVTKQRVASEEQFHAFVNRLEKQLNQFKSELEYRQLWGRFTSGEDAGRCTKGAYSGQVSCTSGLRADLNEYLARLEARNVCASGEWTAVQSDAPTESAASGASAPQSAPPQVEYKDGLVFKFCQRPEFGSSDS